MASRPLRDDSRRTFWPFLGPRAQTTLPQTGSGFRGRVDVARMLALGDARGGCSIHVTTQEPKDPLTSGCRPSGRRPAAGQLATSPRAGTIAAIFPRPAEQHKRIGKQGGWWVSVTHGVARSSYRCRTHIRGGLSRQLVFPLRIIVRSWIFVALAGNGALGPEVAYSREGLHVVDLVVEG